MGRCNRDAVDAHCPAFALGGVFRWVALLDIPAYGLATIVSYRNLTQREQRDGIAFRRKLSDQRKEKLLGRDGVEITAVDVILNEVGLQTPDEVRAALKARAEVKQRKASIEKATEADRAVGQVAKYAEAWSRGPVFLLVCESRSGFSSEPFTRRLAELQAMGRPVFAVAAGRRVS